MRGWTGSRIHKLFRLATVFSACFSSAPSFGQNDKAGKDAGTSLDAYLGQLGYYGIQCRANSQGKLLLDGKVNGKKYTFLVDSGWGMTSLAKKAASGLKTIGEAGVQLEDSAMGRLTNSELVIIEKLSLAEAQFLNQPARPRDLKMDFIRADHEAVLGLDFLYRNFCLIDCGSSKLYVRGKKPSEEQSKALGQTLARSGFVEIQMTNGWAVNAEVNGQPVQLLVDTGSPATVLDDSQARRLRLNSLKMDHPTEATLIPEEIKVNFVGVGKIGSHQLTIAPLKSFAIGTRKLNDFYVGVVNLQAWGVAEKGGSLEDIHGLLGIDVLRRRCGALIDFSSGTLWLLKAEPPKKK